MVGFAWCENGLGAQKHLPWSWGDPSVPLGVGDEGSLLAQQYPTSRAYFQENR